MTARELIAYLGQFSPDAQVWIIYDEVMAYPAKFEPVADDRAELWKDAGLKKGDLVIDVG